LLCAFCPIAVTAALAQAQGTDTSKSGKGRLRAACSTEAQKFCGNIERGKGKLRACLEGHQAELSDSCKTAISQQPKG
jgi:hypothetical protein